MAENPQKLDMKNAKTLEKVLKQLSKNRGSGRDVSGQEFNSSSIKQMGAMTQSQTASFVPEVSGTLGALGGAIGQKKQEIKSKIIGSVAGAGYVAKRLNITAAKRKQKTLREGIQKMYEAAYRRNEPGASAFTQAALKSVKSLKGDDLESAFIDILIQLGATTPEEMDSLFSTFGSGDFDQGTLDNAIEGAASKAGLATSSGKFGLGLKTSGLNSIAGGSDFSPSSSSFTGGPITGKPSAVIGEELNKQTRLLKSIESHLKPDKLQLRENKLEAGRLKKEGGLRDRTNAVGGKDGEDGGGGLLGTILASLGTRLGLTALFKPKTPPRTPPPPKPPKPPVKPTKTPLPKTSGAAGGGILSKITPKPLKTAASKLGSAVNRGVDAAKNSKAVGALKAAGAVVAKVPGAGTAASVLGKGAGVASKALRVLGPAAAVVGAGIGTYVEGTAAYDRAIAAGDSDLSAAGQAAVGGGLGALDSFNILKLATSLLGDSSSKNGIVRALGQADEFMSVENQMHGLGTITDTDAMGTAARGILSTITGGLVASNADATIASRSGNEDRKARNRRKALEGQERAQKEAAERIRRIEIFKAKSAANNGVDATVNAQTVNSGNTSTTNTTIEGQRVGQSETSAAMANAMVRMGGFSAMRFA